MQAARRPNSFARANAGSNSAARSAMMAITTNNSINVNAFARRIIHCKAKGQVLKPKMPGGETLALSRCCEQRFYHAVDGVFLCFHGRSEAEIR